MENVDNVHPLQTGFHIKLHNVYVVIDHCEENATTEWARNQKTDDEISGLALDMCTKPNQYDDSGKSSAKKKKSVGCKESTFHKGKDTGEITHREERHRDDK